MIGAVLETWFGGDRTSFQARWFRSDDALDAACGRLAHLLHEAGSGTLDGWAATLEGALALCLLLDQFLHILRRGNAGAYALDPKAQAIAWQAVLRDGLDRGLTPTGRCFLYLPFEHPERLADQDLSVALFEGLRDDLPHRVPGGSIDFAWRHRAVILHLGRFPHRSALLGRPSTAAEAAYLAEPDAGF